MRQILQQALKAAKSVRKSIVIILFSDSVLKKDKD